MSSKVSVAIIALSCICVMVGTSIAYYNTSSFGYDNANVFTITDDELKVLGFNIEYRKINEFFSKLEKYIPTEIIPI